MSQEFQLSTPVQQPVQLLARPRVALLVDGENLSQDRAGEAILAAAKLGDLMIRRVYGHAPRGPAWLSAPGFHFRQAGTGKNSADMLLTVEAMDIMLRQRADILVIASSDSDFSHVATHLREAGHKVVGIGRASARETFGRACSQFLPLRDCAPALTDMEQQVSGILRDAGPEGLSPVTLNHRMRHLCQCKIGATPERTWAKWLAARPHLYRLDPNGPDARVRLRP